MGHLWAPQERQGVVVELVFGSFLVAGGVLSEPMVAAADADKGGAVFVGDRWVGEVGLGG